MSDSSYGAHRSRRAFLKTTAAAGAGWALGSGVQPAWTEEPAGQAEPLAFFVVSDTHYHAQRERPTKLLPDNQAVNQRLIETLNTLPGQRLPESLGGGLIGTPRGVLHLGDMVDTGDKAGGVHGTMTDSEWKHYVEDYGLTGQDGRLRYPVYEVHGNHDSPRQKNTPIQQIIRRNADRPGLTHVSANGLHYSWDWAGIHFVALGIVVGPNDLDMPVSRYESFDSLPFLIDDLDKHVGDSGRPVVLMQHIDLHRYSRPCETDQASAGSREPCCPGMETIAWCNSGCEQAPGIAKEEWSFCDVAAYYQAIRGYNVAAIFHGHLHGRRIDRWDGKRLDADEGIPVFGSNNSGAGGGNRSLFYCTVDNGQLVIHEYQSRGEHGWDPERAALTWHTQPWKVPLRRPEPAADA